MKLIIEKNQLGLTDKQFVEYLKTRGFAIPKDGKFTIKVCDCGNCNEK